MYASEYEHTREVLSDEIWMMEREENGVQSPANFDEHLSNTVI